MKPRSSRDDVGGRPTLVAADPTIARITSASVATVSIDRSSTSSEPPARRDRPAAALLRPRQDLGARPSGRYVEPLDLGQRELIAWRIGKRHDAAAQSRSFDTMTSLRSPSMRGRATTGGIGVTRFTNWKRGPE